VRAYLEGPGFPPRNLARAFVYLAFAPSLTRTGWSRHRPPNADPEFPPNRELTSNERCWLAIAPTAGFTRKLTAAYTGRATTPITVLHEIQPSSSETNLPVSSNLNLSQ
jgi:hypothetical protein